MTALPLASMLIFASCVATVSGLQCYSCSYNCNSPVLGKNTNVTCSSKDTKCVISKTTLGNGTVFSFKRKCAQDNQCSSPACLGPDENGTYHCNSCCGGDLCNNGTGPIPSTPVGAQSGSSRIPLISGLCMFGSFLVSFLVYKVIMA